MGKTIQVVPYEEFRIDEIALMDGLKLITCPTEEPGVYRPSTRIIYDPTGTILKDTPEEYKITFQLEGKWYGTEGRISDVNEKGIAILREDYKKWKSLSDIAKEADIFVFE